MAVTQNLGWALILMVCNHFLNGKFLIFLSTQPQPHQAVFPYNSTHSCLNLRNDFIDIRTQLINLSHCGF